MPKAQLAHPKPEPRKRVKDRRQRAFRETRASVRLATLERAGWRCEAPDCGQRLHLETAHVHEKVPRSLGGSPLDLENTVALCRGCHDLIHRQRKFMGLLLFPARPMFPK